MEKLFTTPVSMKVTEKQFKNDLEIPLMGMGYRIEHLTALETCEILVNNYEDGLGAISNCADESKLNYNRYFIEPYNPKLFLALAGMTNDENGSIGEYWKYIGGDDDDDFSMYKLYKQISNSITDFYSVIDDKGNQNGYSTSAKQKFIKATKEELIAFFTETKEEVLARFEKGAERELIGYRFRNDDFNKMTYAIDYDQISLFIPYPQGYHFSDLDEIGKKLKELNLLETFCEPVYKEIETISITEAEKVLKGFGREVKIDKDLK